MLEGLTKGCARSKRMLISHISGGEAVLVPVLRSEGAGHGSVYTLNESGTMLWAILEAGRSLAELASALQTEYGLSPDEARDDVQEFIEGLRREGLVEPV